MVFYLILDTIATAFGLNIVDYSCVKLVKMFWLQKITIAPLKNGLSLFFAFRNIENAAIPNNKTIAAHARVHLPF